MHLLYLSKKVGKNGKVFSFEPQPFIHNILRNNIKLNHLENVELFNNGVGYKKEVVKVDEMDFEKVGNFGGVTLSSRYPNSDCGKIKEKKKKFCSNFKA